MSRAEKIAGFAFGLCAVAALALAAVYWRGGQPQAEGALLAAALGALGVGFVVWANYLLPQGPMTQERHELESTEEEREDFEEDFERGGVIERRTFLRRALAVAAGALGIAALFPIRSLGPRPGRSLVETPWRRGLKLVTDDGTPVLATDVPLDGLVTVFPEGSPGSADGQAVLVRVDPGVLSPKP